MRGTLSCVSGDVEEYLEAVGGDHHDKESKDTGYMLFGITFGMKGSPSKQLRQGGNTVHFKRKPDFMIRFDSKGTDNGHTVRERSISMLGGDHPFAPFDASFIDYITLMPTTTTTNNTSTPLNVDQPPRETSFTTPSQEILPAFPSNPNFLAENIDFLIDQITTQPPRAVAGIDGFLLGGYTEPSLLESSYYPPPTLHNQSTNQARAILPAVTNNVPSLIPLTMKPNTFEPSTPPQSTIQTLESVSTPPPSSSKKPLHHLNGTPRRVRRQNGKDPADPSMAGLCFMNIFNSYSASQIERLDQIYAMHGGKLPSRRRLRELSAGSMISQSQIRKWFLKRSSEQDGLNGSNDHHTNGDSRKLLTMANQEATTASNAPAQSSHFPQNHEQQQILIEQLTERIEQLEGALRETRRLREDLLRAGRK